MLQSSEGRDSVLHPSAWLIVPTLSLLGGQAVAWRRGQFQRSGRRLAFAVCAFRFTALAALGDPVLLSRAVVFLWVTCAIGIALPGFPENHLRSVMDGESAALSGRHAASRTGEADKPQPMAGALRSASGIPPAREEISGDFSSACGPCDATGATAIALRFWVRPVDPARQWQSRRIQLCHLFGATRNLRDRLSG